MKAIACGLLVVLLTACAPQIESAAATTAPGAAQSTPCPAERPNCVHLPVVTRGPKRILLVTATAGYYHTSIPTARDVIRQIASDSGEFSLDVITSTAELNVINAASLAAYDVLFFANTSGELPLDAAQQQAILDFVASGKGFVGTHSAADTFYAWNEYGNLIGAYFKSHPWTQSATVDVEDSAHPANAGLGNAYAIFEEFYTFQANPRPNVHVLQSLNAASVGAAGDYPLAWCQAYGSGRVYYNALGHFDSTWNDPRFQSQLLGALSWAAGLVDAACGP
jgi:type 1 glutamine amidotransferase